MNEAHVFLFYLQSIFLCVCVHFSRTVKSPLKVQNGVQEAESPIKKVAKRSRQILDSDDDDVPAVKEQVATKGEKDVAGKTEKVRLYSEQTGLSDFMFARILLILRKERISVWPIQHPKPALKGC